MFKMTSTTVRLGALFLGVAIPWGIARADAGGDALYRSGDFYGAALAYHQASQELSTDPEPYYRCGLCLFRLGRVSEAVKWVKRALALNPDHPAAKVLLVKCQEILPPDRLEKGIADFRAGLYASALVQFNWAVLENPGSVAAHFNLAVTLYKLGQLVSAMREVRQTLALEPRHAGAHYLQGVLYQLEGEQQKSLNAFEAIATSHRPEFYSFRARERIRMGRTISRPSLRGSLRSFFGMSRGWPREPNPYDSPGDTNRDASLQGGWGPWGGWKGLFFGSLGMSLTDHEEGRTRDVWANLGASCNPTLSKHLSFWGEVTGLRAFRGRTPQYVQWEAAGALQVRAAGLEYWQIQLQLFREQFPPTAGMNANSGLLNFLGRQPLGGLYSLQWIGSLRLNYAQDPAFRYRSGMIGASLQRGMWKRWSGETGLRVQSLVYPSRWASPEGRRTDLLREAFLEVNLQVVANLYATLGDLATFLASNEGGVSVKTNRVYTGIQCYL